MSQGIKRRRHDLTLGDKMNMIRLIDSHTSQTDIAKMYNCSQSQISRIVSKRDDIISDWEACDDPAKKKSRFTIKEQPPKKKDSIRIVTDQSTSPGPPSESDSYDRGEQSQTPYSASTNGLVEYWKNHSASYGRRSYGDFDSDYSPLGRYPGSSGRRGVRGRPKPSLNKESRISNQMLDILKSYDVCDVYCADELALLYDAMPSFENSENDDADEADGENDKKDTTATGSQKQITVLLTCNVTGSDKREFLIIEDSKQSEPTPAIAGCHRAKAPHAWMTADVYREYLLALDYDMRKQKRYILLLVDNAAPHDPEAGKSLEHVRVLYIRSYTTPFFHGIFYSVRAHYRKQILLKLFANNPEIAARSTDNRGKRRSKDKTSPAFTLNINFEEAVGMLKQAWQSVCPQELVQCFSKAGICAPHIHGLPESSDDDLPELPDGFITDEQYEDFVNIDVDAECSGDADLVSAECRILSDLRDQGFVDIETEPSDDHDLSMDGSGLNIPRKQAFNSAKMDSMAMSSGDTRSENRNLGDSSGEIERSLSTLRNILAQRGLSLHNLHALESQIYSCHSGGHKEEKFTPSN